MTDWASIVGGTAGGAAISGLLGPYISSARSRRETRAAVQSALTLVEGLRWAQGPSSDEMALQGKTSSRDYGAEFDAAINTLFSAAIIAGIDRDAVEFYCDGATAARVVSVNNWREFEGGSIPSELAEHVRDCFELVSDLVWHRFRVPGTGRRRLHGLERQRAVLKTPVNDERRLAAWPFAFVESSRRARRAAL